MWFHNVGRYLLILQILSPVLNTMLRAGLERRAPAWESHFLTSRASMLGAGTKIGAISAVFGEPLGDVSSHCILHELKFNVNFDWKFLNSSRKEIFDSPKMRTKSCSANNCVRISFHFSFSLILKTWTFQLKWDICFKIKVLMDKFGMLFFYIPRLVQFSESK